MSRDDRGQGKPRRKARGHARGHEYRAHPEQHYDLLGHDTNDLSSCDRKKRYKSKQLAKNAARILLRVGWKQYPYECRVCRQWHLTKQEPAVTRRQRRGWTGSRASAPTTPPTTLLQETAPTVQKRESEPPMEVVVPMMTTEKSEKQTDKHADIARAAGYVSAEELGASNQTLDALCRECHLAPMVLGTTKFYPAEECRKELTARAVPEGMVAAIDWAREHGIDRNKVPNAIRDGKYTGKSHFGRMPDLVGKPRYYILPEEAAEYCGLNKKVEPVAEKVALHPEAGSWITLDEASAATGLAKSRIRALGDSGEVLSRNDMGEYKVFWDDLDAYGHTISAYGWSAGDTNTAVSVPDAPAPPPAPINEDVLQMVREANARQREMHADMKALVKQLQDLESRIDAKLAAGAAVWKKTVADRDAAHAQSIADAVAQALDEFERGRRPLRGVG